MASDPVDWDSLPLARGRKVVEKKRRKCELCEWEGETAALEALAARLAEDAGESVATYAVKRGISEEIRRILSGDYPVGE